ncbi:hypothetical protein FV139_17320 [Parahaliea maris]|uniref:Uncharacterized protein n=1 Tax=Parahaliea maris TaxID=2716870 RepID=A0A5C8ZTZ5_9GAMM|nr:hypothetical protein [Parahaliea maris]TXS90741.1 hypothetical protein FV139_17320 [Parahaliea maris]
MRPVLIASIATIALLLWLAADAELLQGTGPASTEHRFHAADLNPATGRLHSLGSDRYRVTLDGNGFAVLELRTANTRIGDFGQLVFLLQPGPGLVRSDFVWRTHGRQFRMLELPISDGERSVDLNSLNDLPPALAAVALRFQGDAGSTLEISGLALEPDTFSAKLAATVGNWLSPLGWNHASINAHLGVANAGIASWPVPLTAWLCGLLIAVVVLLMALGVLSAQQALTLATTVFIGGWLLLDALWLRQLLHRADSALQAFRGQPEYARRVAMGDQSMAELSARIQPLIGESGQRIFVSSAGDYQGMRLAWYLYPHNVYWLRDGPELPGQEYLHKGDLVAVIAPSTLRYLPEEGVLAWPGHYQVAATPVASTSTGALYRVL